MTHENWLTLSAIRKEWGGIVPESTLRELSQGWRSKKVGKSTYYNPEDVQLPNWEPAYYHKVFFALISNLTHIPNDWFACESEMKRLGVIMCKVEDSGDENIAAIVARYKNRKSVIIVATNKNFFELPIPNIPKQAKNEDAIKMPEQKEILVAYLKKHAGRHGEKIITFEMIDKFLSQSLTLTQTT